VKRRQACLLIAGAPALAADFASNWSSGSDQIWLGPEYWANRLQDWRLSKGRIECSFAGGDRNVFLLTHELSSRAEPFEIRVKLGPLEDAPGGQGYAGFRIGMKGPFNDYRDTAIYGIGLDAGITSDGRLFIGRLAYSASMPFKDTELILRGEPGGKLTLSAGEVSASRTVPADWTTGGIALVCSSGSVAETPDPTQNVMTMSGINRRGRENTGSLRTWFRDWKVTGVKVDGHPERAWGPILFALHTLSRGVMKLTAQMAPVTGRVRLQIQRGSSWRTAGESSIDPLSRTAVFRIPKWDDTRDIAYRLIYGGQNYEGTIRRDPRHKEKIAAAGLSCINDLGFPHSEIARNLEHFKPDLLLFTGDQIYERSGSYGIERTPIERASLDYLRKWYLLGWSFRDLLRDTPAVCMPDDHDVYHGNVWGAGGRRAEGVGQPGQDSGGYVQAAEWVNMVQRTQTSHLPDPFDPTPVEQGIGVYYTDLLYGGVSFAILEDRKWKSPPKETLPAAKIVNGWAQNPDYNPPKDGDAAGAQLLGPRQIAFLKRWAEDWNGGVWMKAAVSQTIFANVATLPKPANTDAVTPKLPVLAPGSYGEGEMLVADHDSNGWPQTPRNDAIRQIRRALAVHIAGDQHLGSTIQYGVDDWNDAGWAICVPAVSNLFPRRWYPPERGRNQKPGAARNTGEYLDGFGNKITVHAVFNPSTVDAEPKIVNHRAPGYGIIEFDRSTQKVTLTNWPRWVDASRAGAQPCAGWPIVVRQSDNGLPKSGWALPAVKSPEKGALLQVAAAEILYSYRLVEESFRPPVPGPGKYTITIRSAAGRVLVRQTIEALRI
jgi:phosphodiesterase/alkaline phosphatase D-like protein